MNLYDNLKYFARILNVPSENIDLLLKRIGLYEHRKKMAGKLSKGQRQRLILARAILHRPKVLFLDEPTNGLDPSASNEIHKLLMELKNEGMAIFLTTHNMEEAAKLCDNVALLNDGVIVEYGSPQAICLKHNQIKKYRVRLTDGTTHLLLQNEKTTGQIAQWMNSGQLETIHSCEPTLELYFWTQQEESSMKITAIHFRKLSAVTEMKMRTLMSKNFIIMPIFSLGFTFLMKNTVPIHR